MKEDDLDDFWSKLGFVLMTIDGMEDQNAAAALGAFLEGYLEGMERGQHPQSRFVHAD